MATAEQHDGALRRVSSMLGHKSVTTTELYLDVDMARQDRNRLLRGQRMFEQATHAAAA